MGEETARVFFSVAGMSCAACARRVEKASRRRWNANFATGKVTVKCDPDAANLERLVEGVESAGYGAGVRRQSPSWE